MIILTNFLGVKIHMYNMLEIPNYAMVSEIVLLENTNKFMLFPVMNKNHILM